MKILVDLPDEVHRRLKAAAKADHRSVNAEVNVAIEAFLGMDAADAANTPGSTD